MKKEKSIRSRHILGFPFDYAIARQNVIDTFVWLQVQDDKLNDKGAEQVNNSELDATGYGTVEPLEEWKRFLRGTGHLFYETTEFPVQLPQADPKRHILQLASSILIAKGRGFPNSALFKSTG